MPLGLLRSAREPAAPRPGHFENRVPGFARRLSSLRKGARHGAQWRHPRLVPLPRRPPPPHGAYCPAVGQRPVPLGVAVSPLRKLSAILRRSPRPPRERRSPLRHQQGRFSAVVRQGRRADRRQPGKHRRGARAGHSKRALSAALERQSEHGGRDLAATGRSGGGKLKKLSDYVIEFVARAGVNHIFMLAGGGCMHLADSVGRARDLEYVCCLHEQACAFAAEAYAEYTNHLGVALVTTGPGGTNAVTGVAAAWIEGASCLFLSGQAKRADLIGGRGVRSMGPQEVDIVSIVRPITKYAKTILDPQSIRYELEKAVHFATHGRRGPVWLDIPLDVQATMLDESSLPGYPSEEEPGTTPELQEQVAAAIDLLNQSQRPVLLLGSGVRTAAAAGLVKRLVETLKIPVLLTWKVVGLDR